MIKQIYVVECDACGTIASAKKFDRWPEGIIYKIPEGWINKNNNQFCLCPDCARKLNLIERTEAAHDND